MLKKAGYKAPNQQRERGGDEKELLVSNLKEKDFSIAINMDLKLFTQRFFEFIHITKNFSEIHDFVQKLMESEYVGTYESKVQLIKNLLKGFVGLKGDQDEIVLTSILNLIIQRLLPEDVKTTGSLVEIKKSKKQFERLKLELREWQNVMFAAEVPQLMLEYIDIGMKNTFLSNKAIILLNNLMTRSTEKNQEKILEILK